MGICCSGYFWPILGIVLYLLYKFLPKIILQRRLARWDDSKCPKDIVILHGVPRSKTIPASSPFVLKMETFLRMAKIPYQYDGKDPLGPKGKTPWLSLNGKHYPDTQLCIDLLSKKHGINLNGNYSPKDLAIASTVRIALEDHCFWALVMWAFVWPGEGRDFVQKWMKLPYPIFRYLCYSYKNTTWAQGTGRHSKEDIEAWTFKDLRNISEILGKNKFLLGDEPCLEDASFFGFCAQFFWGFAAASPYAKLVQDEMPNIKEYCNRMKERYYPDWDELLAKSTRK